MLSLFKASTGLDDGRDGAMNFSYGLRRARLDLVLNDPEYSRWFVRACVGVDD
jgi:hypothetical protein